jgi:exodeoxyribonuclease X
MSAIILDTETTDATEEAQVIELGISTPIEDLSTLAAEPALTMVFRYSATRPISLGAMSVHHILEEDIAGFPVFPGIGDHLSGIEYMVGHNIDFDWRVIGKPSIKRICTLALSRYLWPEIDSHKLGAMVYHLTPFKGEARTMVHGAHSAGADVNMILLCLLPAIKKALGESVRTWNDLWAISEQARIPTRMAFGKHKGVAIQDVPPDYKRWLLNQPDVGPVSRRRFAESLI